jgi:hypothetical protein
MRRILWTIPLAFFFLNPSFACGPADDAPQFHYGAVEMRAAVEGVWSFAIMPEGAAGPIKVMVKVQQAASAPGAEAHASATGRSLIRPAHACGSRTLVRSAGACVDISTMPLTVTFVDGDASFASAPMSGAFEVMGTEFDAPSTELQLMIGGYDIEAQLGPDGVPVDPHVGPNGSSRGTLTIATRS